MLLHQPELGSNFVAVVDGEGGGVAESFSPINGLLHKLEGVGARPSDIIAGINIDVLSLRHVSQWCRR